MVFDFKKEYKEFYLPKNKPEIVTVPPANCDKFHKPPTKKEIMWYNYNHTQ